MPTSVGAAPGPRWRVACLVALAMTSLAIGGGPGSRSSSVGIAAADAGVVVADEGPVTASDRRVNSGNNSPQIVTDPGDNDVMALAHRLDAPDFSCGLHVSGDGGESWVPVDPVPELPDGAETCYGPEIGFGPDGTLYYLFVGLAGEGNRPMGVYLTSSDDSGQSFSEPQQLLDELKFGVRMAIDREAGETGRLHFTWIDGGPEVGVGAFGPPPNPIMAAYSEDRGQTLSEPVQVSDADRDRVVGPALQTGPNGDVHVAYYDLLDDRRDYQGLEGPVWDGHWELVTHASDDGGESFESGVVVDEVTPHERIMVIFTTQPPALAVGENGRRCLAWTDARHGDADVLVSCSPPGSNRWSTPVRANDNPPESGTTQELPQLSISADGRIDVVFYDRRDDQEHDVFSHTSFAYSTDGGESFSASTQLTSHPSNSSIGQQYAIPSAEGMNEFGDRLALTSSDERAVAAWADTRNIQPPSRAQDVFAARVTGLPDGPGANSFGWIGAGVAAGGAVVLAFAGFTMRRRRESQADSAHEASS